MKKTVLLIVLLFGLHHVISDGTIGIGVFTASAQQMANEFDEYDDGNNGGEGSSINGGELPNTDVWGHQPDNYNDIWGTISAIQDWLDNLNNPNNSENGVPSTSEDYGGGGGGSTSEEDRNFRLYTPTKKDYLIVPRNKVWTPQYGMKECVITVMKYASQYLQKDEVNYREAYKSLYANIDINYNSREFSGVAPDKIEQFVNDVFYNEQIMSRVSLDEYLSDNTKRNPVITTIPGNPYSDWGYLSHEIMIVGYTSDKNYYIYVDPMNGRTRTISYYKISGPTFALLGLR